MNDLDPQKAAWDKRHRLNEIADRLEDQMEYHACATDPDGSGTWANAVRSIAANPSETAELALNLSALVHYIRDNYPMVMAEEDREWQAG
jgi:hypothetical protein